MKFVQNCSEKEKFMNFNLINRYLLTVETNDPNLLIAGVHNSRNTAALRELISVS